MKIHKLIETTVARFESDPIHGQQRVLRTVIAPAHDWKLSHEGKEYELDLEDGTFEVPNELGQLLIKRAGWHEGLNPFADELRASLKPAKKAKAEPEKAAARKTAKSTKKAAAEDAATPGAIEHAKASGRGKNKVEAVDLGTVEGTGAGDRITKSDVEAARQADK